MVRVRRAPIYFKALSALVAGWKDQRFLDRGWIAPVLRISPTKWKKSEAIWLIALSPHYYYPFGSEYDGVSTRNAVLAEHRRMVQSRREIAEEVVIPYLDPGARILDFGCGPGYLTRALAGAHLEAVGVDISRGPLACAEILNGDTGALFMQSGKDGKIAAPDSSFDAICTLAVIQHLLPDQATAVFREFGRVLRAGGIAIVHMPVGVPEHRSDPGSHLWNRYRLHYDGYDHADLAEMAAGASLTIEAIRPAPSIIGTSEHIVLLRR
jgi:SAM-dependent methyltransferase